MEEKEYVLSRSELEVLTSSISTISKTYKDLLEADGETNIKVNNIKTGIFSILNGTATSEERLKEIITNLDDTIFGLSNLVKFQNRKIEILESALEGQKQE